MFTSFSTALSGLRSHATGMDVVGNNLANLNTTGFKASTVAFHDLVSQSLGSGLGETQVGFGVGQPRTLRQFSQGAIRGSGGTLDVAIQGDGFLVTRNGDGALQFTRGGNLKTTREGTLVTMTGERIQGWSSNGGVVDTSTPLGDITVPTGTLKPPRSTRSFSLDANLNSAAPVGSSFSTSIEVYDSLGSSHVLTARFEKTAENRWQVTNLGVPAADASAPGLTTPIELEFDSSGRLTSPAAGTAQTIEITGFTNGAADMTGPTALTWSLYDEAGEPRLTQFAQPSSVSANLQDGAAAAQLVRVSIGNGGLVLAQYSNGEQSIVGQLGMAAIRNPDSLIASGNNAYQLSAFSAAPAYGLPGTGGRGLVLGGSIEGSTVDIAQEFTNLITLQRGYQASARVITTVDEISQETINLKR